jgi:ATP-dependent DNA helicase RecG
LIIERGQVRTENSNRPHGFGALNPETFTPFPKNPVIAAFFRQIGRADELGSGMRKMMRYGKAYGGADPQMIEGDVFRIIVKVPEFGAIDKQQDGPKSGPSRAYDGAHDGTYVAGEVTGEVAGEVADEVCKLIQVIGKKALTRAEAQSALSLKGQSNFRERYLEPALKAELIEMTIPDKPTSKKQKYRLTENGREMLDKTK